MAVYSVRSTGKTLFSSLLTGASNFELGLGLGLGLGYAY